MIDSSEARRCEGEETTEPTPPLGNPFLKAPDKETREEPQNPFMVRRETRANRDENEPQVPTWLTDVGEKPQPNTPPVQITSEPVSEPLTLPPRAAIPYNHPKPGVLLRDYPNSSHLAVQIVDRLDREKGGLDVTINQILNPFSPHRAHIKTMPNSWGGLAVRDALFDVSSTSTFYERLTEKRYRFSALNADDVHEYLPNTPGFSQRAAEELATALLAYSFAKWYGESPSMASITMARGHWNPSIRDLKFAFRGLGRPRPSASLIISRINDQRDAGYIPDPEYALRTRTASALVRLTGLRDFNSRPFAERANILRPLLDAPSHELMQNPSYWSLMLDYYEGQLGEFTYWRAGKIDRSEVGTWNHRFGAPTQDQLLYLFTRTHYHDLDEIFDADAARLFKNSSETRLNPDLSYADISAKLKLLDQQKGTQFADLLDSQFLSEKVRSASSFGFAEENTGGKYQAARSGAYRTLLLVREWVKHVKPGKAVRS
ncbi:MAG: hypothetical protein AAFN91_00855 [Pseudomonadota bacterium]